MRHLLSIKGLLILALLVLSASPVCAIKHCHDYTVWVVTGNNANDTPPNRVRDILRQNNYEITLTTTAATPGVDERLRPGDVVFFGHAHSGVVNSQGRIDHFLQNMQQAGKHYDPAELPSLPNFYRGWTMVQFANISREAGVISTDFATDAQTVVHYPYRNMKVEVWRRRQDTAAGKCSDLTGRWSNTIPIGTSTWEIRRSGGGYEAFESGMGSAKSKSVTFSGKTLRIEWVTGGIEGYYEWQLDANCQQSTSGTLVWTRGLSGSHRSTLKRQ